MTEDRDIIRRRPDGSIDTAFYIARSREARAEQAHHLTVKAAPAAGGTIFAALAAMFGFPSSGA
jgi:hypothetical protein